MEAWRSSVRDALNMLKDALMCEAVSLIGLRMGATLAALCAQDDLGIENLVLWEPVVKGRRYVRELSALAQTARQSSSGGENVEAVGYLYSFETIRSLGAVDLTTATPVFSRGLIVRNELGSKDTALLDHLLKLGRHVEQVAFDGYEDMMAEPQDTVIPEAALSFISKWLRSTEHDADMRGHLFAPEKAAFDSSMILAGPGQVRERVHRISEVPDLFGITSEPEKVPENHPWIVMLNGGAAHRVGPNRLYVKLARDLASLGFPSFRIDISGIGDSEADEGRLENDTYPATAVRDASLTIDYLRRLKPGRSIVLMGLCSGAYAGFQAAAQLPQSELVESILINPLTFFWREGMSIEAPPTQHLQAWHYYRGIILDWRNWWKLLSGKTNMGLKGAVTRFFQRMFVRRPFEPMLSSGTFDAAKWGGYSHPAKEDLTADLTSAEAKRRMITMFISENDPGYFLLMHKARRKALAMIRGGKLNCTFVEGADHTFSTVISRDKLSGLISRHLISRYSRMM